MPPQSVIETHHTIPVLTSLGDQGTISSEPDDDDVGSLQVAGSAMAQKHAGTSVTTPPRVRVARSEPGWRVTEPMASIRGRDAELASVLTQLAEDAARLVTLTGPGGVGKTRLAREVALRLQDDFADGACFIPFAPVRDAGHIGPAIVRALGLQPSESRSLDELVFDTLRDRHVLLLLDNLEHIVEAIAPWVTSLLESCRRLSVLATSRLPLRIDGEQRFVLEPLDLPHAGAEHDSEDARSTAAIALFVERACAIDPEFELTPDNTHAVIEICRMVGGLPLAIELAAAQIRLLAPRQLAERLDGRLTRLRGDRVDMPDRHRTMHDTIAWSHDLLVPESQTLFRWLSAFPGGFSLDVAEAVGMSAGFADVEGALLELVEHSLVRRHESRPDGYRFAMLEVVREFGLTKLETHADTDRASEAMVGLILQLGRQAGTELYGPSQAVWLERLEAERDNLQAVFAWLRDRGRVAEAAELAVNTIPFRGIRGYSSQDLPLLEELLEHPGLAGEDVARANALLALAVARRTTTAVGGGVDAIEEALPIYRRAGLRMRVALSLQHEIIELLGMGEYERARNAAEECILLGRELDFPAVEIVGVMYLGALAWLQGRVEDTRKYFRQVRSIPREKWPPELLALQSFREAQMHHSLGDDDAAERCIRESMALGRNIGAKASSASAFEMLGRIAHLREDFEAARRYYDQGMQTAIDAEIPGLANEIASFAAELEKDMGHLDAAIRDLRRVTAEADFDRYPHGLGSSLDQYTDLAIHAGDLAQAARFMGAADAVYGGKGIRRWPGLSTERREQREAKLRMSLGGTAFASAHAAGKALAADAAVEEMLSWQPDLDRDEPQLSQEVPEGLSPRELEVLKLMADGLTNQEIADTLFVSHRTAAAHSSNIIGKLGVSSRTGAVAYAIRNGLA